MADYRLTVKDGHVEVLRGAITSFSRKDLKAGSVAETFVLFPNLPQETQDQIWMTAMREASSPTAEVILAKENTSYRNGREGFWIGQPAFSLRRPALPDLFVLVRRGMVELAVTNKLYTKLEVPGHETVLFRPELDVVRLQVSHTVLRRLCDVIGLDSIATIRHVELDGEHMDLTRPTNKLSLDVNLRSMTNLQTLRIIGHIQIYPGCDAPQFVRMTYERRANNDSMIYVPVIDKAGVEHVGHDFMTEIFQDITDDEECFRYINMWETLSQLAFNGVNLPSVIHVKTQYEVHGEKVHRT